MGFNLTDFVEDVVIDTVSLDSVVIDGDEVWSAGSDLVAGRYFDSGSSIERIGYLIYGILATDVRSITPNPIPQYAVGADGHAHICSYWRSSNGDRWMEFSHRTPASTTEPPWTTLKIRGDFEGGAADRTISYTQASATYDVSDDGGPFEGVGGPEVHRYIWDPIVANDRLVDGNTYKVWVVI